MQWCIQYYVLLEYIIMAFHCTEKYMSCDSTVVNDSIDRLAIKHALNSN